MSSQSSHLFHVTVEDQNQRLDVYLTTKLSEDFSRVFIKKLIDNGCVRVNEAKVKAGHKVKSGDDVLVEIPEDFLTPQYIEAENIPLDIFYEDEYLFVINKSSGMLVHPAQNITKGTLVNALLYRNVNLSSVNTQIRPGIVHRLDQETSGLILVAKDNITHTKLAKQFQRHTVKKKYIALVQGEINFDEGVIKEPIGRHLKYRDKKAVSYDESAKEAHTMYRVIKRNKGFTLVALYPKTGRTHQLRVHMAHLKHPILGDEKYGKKQSFSRLALHAQSIGFIHPGQRSFVEFSTRIPAEFLSFINLVK